MRKRFMALQLSVFFCLIGFLSTATSQSPQLEVSHVIAPINQLSVSDIDFRNSTTPKWLFTINIRILDGSNRRATMSVRAGFMLPDANYNNAITFSTDTFDVRGFRSISNLDLDRSIRLTNYTIDRPARTRLEQVALESGQIPAGGYTFHVTVTLEDGSQGQDDITIDITNPTTVELIAPPDGDPFATEFPLFQWQFDGSQSRISIFEKFPSQSSLEEAASGVPHYTTVTSTNSLQYPSAGARILEPGKTYVWFVEGLIGSAGGTTVAQKSSLRSFTVTSKSGQTLSSLLDELARALPQYQTTFDDIKAQGFTNASTIRLNGAAISMPDLMKLLNTLRSNPDAVTSLEFQ